MQKTFDMTDMASIIEKNLHEFHGCCEPSFYEGYHNDPSYGYWFYTIKDPRIKFDFVKTNKSEIENIIVSFWCLNHPDIIVSVSDHPEEDNKICFTTQFLDFKNLRNHFESTSSRGLVFATELRASLDTQKALILADIELKPKYLYKVKATEKDRTIENLCITDLFNLGLFSFGDIKVNSTEYYELVFGSVDKISLKTIENIKGVVEVTQIPFNSFGEEKFCTRTTFY